MTSLASCHKQGSAEDGVGSPFSGLRYHVKNVNPSTPLVYPNRRFHKKHYARRKHLLWLQLRSYLLPYQVK